MSVDKATIEKLKKILIVSNRIKITRMQNVLEMDEKKFDKKLID